jgi:hypothetical protein
MNPSATLPKLPELATLFMAGELAASSKRQ